MAELEPIEQVATQVAAADVHYVLSSLVGLPGDAVAAELALVQYGAMAAYETQLHFRVAVGWELDPSWDPVTAKGARMSGKFFADTKRNLDGVVDHFDDLLAANHGAFFPQRRLKLVDRFRTDLSVVTAAGRPYMTSVSGHYLTGLQPSQTAARGVAGPVLQRLAEGVGRVGGTLLQATGLGLHEPLTAPTFEWWNARSAEALPRLFGGQLPPALAASLTTVQSIVISAVRSPDRVRCDWCERAARKHRFVATFQATTALKILRDDGACPVPAAVAAFLDGPGVQWLLQQRKLRNAYVHLGMSDIRDRIAAGDKVDAAVAAYTGIAAADVDGRVQPVLLELAAVLTGWMLTPGVDGNRFEDALHRENSM